MAIGANTPDAKTSYKGGSVSTQTLGPSPYQQFQPQRMDQLFSLLGHRKSAPTVQAPTAPQWTRSGPVDGPVGTQPPKVEIPQQGMDLPLRPANGISYQGLSNWGTAYTRDPLAIERGYILI